MSNFPTLPRVFVIAACAVFTLSACTVNKHIDTVLLYSLGPYGDESLDQVQHDDGPFPRSGPTAHYHLAPSIANGALVFCTRSSSGYKGNMCQIVMETPREFDRYRLTLFLDLAGLRGTSGHFTVLLDTPTVRTLTFKSSGEVDLLTTVDDELATVTTDYRWKDLTRLCIEADTDSGGWRIVVDETEIFVADASINQVQSVRLALRDDPRSDIDATVRLRSAQIEGVLNQPANHRLQLTGDARE